MTAMFKCGGPQKLWMRFSSEQGNLHSSIGYIIDSGARLVVLTEQILALLLVVV